MDPNETGNRNNENIYYDEVEKSVKILCVCVCVEECVCVCGGDVSVHDWGGYDLSAFHFSRHLRDEINIRRRTGMRRRETEEGKRKEGLVVPNEIQRIKKKVVVVIDVVRVDVYV